MSFSFFPSCFPDPVFSSTNLALIRNTNKPGRLIKLPFKAQTPIKQKANIMALYHTRTVLKCNTQVCCVFFFSYMANLDRIAAPDYIPTAQDVLRVRFPTTGINDYTFSVEKITLRYRKHISPRFHRRGLS